MYETYFAALKQPLSKNAALAEAARCLFCFDAPCTRMCPAHIDVPKFIRKITTHNFTGSARTILEQNILGESCSKVCPVETLCEGACVMNEKGELPIQIGRLQLFATQWLRESGKTVFDKAAPNQKSVGLVGAGPASLACAACLAVKGYDTTIYGADRIPGGLNATAIAAYKLHTEDALEEIRMIEKMGVVIKPGTRIGSDLTIDQLLETHDALFIGTGLGMNHQLEVPGMELDGVLEALSFIKNAKTLPFKDLRAGRDVVVIGGGNTAIDAALAAKLLGADSVTVVYRRSKTEMPAYDHEYELAMSKGVVFQFLAAPVRIEGDTSVTSITCNRMELGEPDESGRRRPMMIKGSEFSIKADRVLVALGQKADIKFLASLPNTEIRNGLLVTDSESGQTGNPRIFAGGDLVHGAKEVVDAVQSGKVAAHGIDSFLSGKEGS
ncbi:MAG: NAD(P)-dependent oxidoreductase [bacterium]